MSDLIKISDAMKNARKIVIKIGSNTLAKADGTTNIEFMQGFAEQCKSLIDSGKQIVLVSSGAQVSGLATIHNWARKRDVHYRQALCAIGQVELMNQWRKAFAKQDLHIGQLLLTKEDFEDDHRTLNMRNTIFTLVDEGVIPIINENDSVSFDEIKIGDNDNLSALTAILWSADLLVLFSDIDGIYTDNPKTNKDAKLIETVTNIKNLRDEIKIGSSNSFGTGGIETKIQAAEKVCSYGIPMILANGSHHGELNSLMNGTSKGTLFLGEENCLLKEIK
ncbi:MAG: glutamate 5-kinase [Treponema sp.]|jgi:glutamate 5-kinase|nr:glutamate 5-kinase [Treponema sp.]MBQ2233900.1 glutamate 5-kinase [Treponema sp.]MBQ5632969.1 glutamate 5-kinase [Treponema sp.]MBQ5645490.1 glutamate 5-kinase [Treponema sp.]MBQ5849106.1 glutamate 5-kinase [Treponema sp.]